MDKRKTNPSYRKAVRERCGDTCYVCGGTPVEYHHLIPLYCGGEETVENHIALCYKHHLQMHGCVGRWDRNQGGRPKETPPENYTEVLDGYFLCEYGAKRCMEKMETSPGGKLQDKWWYKEYIEERGIKSHRNNIDLLVNKSARFGRKTEEYPQDKQVGFLEYQNGKVEWFCVSGVKEW